MTIAALVAHFTTLLKLRGQEITYSNGTTTKTFRAVRSRPRANQVDAADGFVISSKNWEWLIRQSDLGFEAKLGHTIVSDSVTYKVQPSNPNDLAYRPSDGQGTFIRVFTEQQ